MLQVPKESRLQHMSWRSVRVKMMLGLFLIVVPLIVFLIYSNVYAIEVVRNQVAESNKDLLSLYREQVDGRLKEADNYMFGLMSDSDLEDLQYLTGADERTFAAHRISTDLSNAIVRFPVLDGLFVYLSSDEQYLYAFKERSTITDRSYIRSHVTEVVSRQPDPAKQNRRKWYIAKNGDQVYLVRTLIQRDGSVVGAWINVHSFQTPLDLLGIGDEGAAVLGDNGGNPIVNQRFVYDHGAEIRPDAPSYYLTGEHDRFLAVGELSQEGEFGLYAFIPQQKILQHLPTLKSISYLLPFASVLLLLIGFIMLRKTLLVPINRLLQTMNRIRQGNIDMQIQQYPTSVEFQIVNDTFNRMMKEIKHLRINVYEEQLNKQKAELQHLQLQIKPHFFINTLNMMHTLARMKDVQRMEEMSLCLVRYFRYMFQSNLHLVPLKDELQHVRNYIRIQELRFPEQIVFDMDVPDFVLRTPVPPLVIHTFVENAVKHGVTLDEPVRIEIRIEMIDSPLSGLLLQIRDTGPGFKADMIENIKQDKRIIDDEGEHIGIRNVKQRLLLMYGEQASVELSDAEPRGAAVAVRLPFVPETGAAHQNIKEV